VPLRPLHPHETARSQRVGGERGKRPSAEKQVLRDGSDPSRFQVQKPRWPHSCTSATTGIGAHPIAPSRNSQSFYRQPQWATTSLFTHRLRNGLVTGTPEMRVSTCQHFGRPPARCHFEDLVDGEDLHIAEGVRDGDPFTSAIECHASALRAQGVGVGGDGRWRGIGSIAASFTILHSLAVCGRWMHIADDP